jgi:type VI secretion system protein ImpJ
MPCATNHAHGDEAFRSPPTAPLGFAGSASTASTPAALVVQEITQRAKLASHGDIDFVLSRNVSGIRVNTCERPPAEVPMRPGLTYFTLPAPDDDVYWKHVRKDHDLVGWLPPSLDAEQCAVSLYGLLDG